MLKMKLKLTKDRVAKIHVQQLADSENGTANALYLLDKATSCVLGQMVIDKLTDCALSEKALGKMVDDIVETYQKHQKTFYKDQVLAFVKNAGERREGKHSEEKENADD